MQKRASMLLCLLLAACGQQSASPPPRVVEERPFAGTAPRGEPRLKRNMLTMHNATRAEVRQPVLTWSDALAADALAYARELARTGRFEHAPQPRGNPNQGENLWMGTRGAYRYEEMAGHWIDEKRVFVNRPMPNASTTGNYRDVGHYTQIIWSGTREVGCAMASNRRDDFLVCRYLPTGNVVGQRALP